jgi:maleate isomerase
MNKPTYEAELHMADDVEYSAGLLADAKVDVIGFACTTGSFIKGKGYDQEIIHRIVQATGVPATTSTTAILKALDALGIKKMVLLSAYTEQMNEIEQTFFKEMGFETLAHKGLSLGDCVLQYDVDPSRWQDMIKEMEHPEADGYLISCGGIRAVDIIEQTEQDLGKPVLTSNQALAWHCLRKIGVRDEIEGFGGLLRKPL